MVTENGGVLGIMTEIKRYDGIDTDVDARLYSDGALFIYGTSSKQDIIQDLKWFPSIFQEIKMHLGSLEQAKELELLLGDDIKLIKEIKAHSLGCAVAEYFTCKYPISAALYGGFRPFPLWYRMKHNDSKVINYIYHTDIVPRIFFWRKYSGEVVHIKGKGFHPITDHLRYQDLNEYVGYMEDEL